MATGTAHNSIRRRLRSNRLFIGLACLALILTLSYAAIQPDEIISAVSPDGNWNARMIIPNSFGELLLGEISVLHEKFQNRLELIDNKTGRIRLIRQWDTGILTEDCHINNWLLWNPDSQRFVYVYKKGPGWMYSHLVGYEVQPDSGAVQEEDAHWVKAVASEKIHSSNAEEQTRAKELLNRFKENEIS